MGPRSGMVRAFGRIDLPTPRLTPARWGSIKPDEQVFETTDEGRVIVIEASHIGYRCAKVRFTDGQWVQNLDHTVVLNAAVMARMRREGSFTLARDLPPNG